MSTLLDEYPGSWMSQLPQGTVGVEMQTRGSQRLKERQRGDPELETLSPQRLELWQRLVNARWLTECAQGSLDLPALYLLL